MLNKIKLINIIKNGGDTITKKGDSVNFENGFQVSKKDCYILSIKNVNKILKAVNKLLQNINACEFVGLWVDDYKIYIDISERIATLEKALQIGRERKQLSVFNWSDKTCINC